MKFSQITLAITVANDLKPTATGAHAVRMYHVRHAIDSALRGNATELDQGVAACIGKGKKVDAYKAGFSVVGRPAKFAYTGKLTDEVRAAIATQADALAQAFSDAFAAVLPVVDAAPKTDAEKAEAKAKKAARADETGAAWAKENGYVQADSIAKAPEFANVTPTYVAGAVASMADAGAFDAGNIEVMLKALNAAVKRSKAPAPAPVAAPVLLATKGTHPDHAPGTPVIQSREVRKASGKVAQPA